MYSQILIIVLWCGHTNTKKLEKVQFRALKFVYSDYYSTYEQLLLRANLPTLALGRIRKLAIEVYRIMKGMSPAYLLQTFNKQSAKYNLRNQTKIIYNCNNSTRNGLESFRHYGAKIWNSLPETLRTVSDFKVFKTLIKTWNGPVCKCCYCQETALL